MKINLFYKTKKRVLSLVKLKKIIKKIVEIVLPKCKKIELNFLFVGNKEIKKFNRKFLKKNYATDVLCFKYDQNLADIVVSVEQVVKNAKKYKSSPKKELVFVITHGILHFKGMKDDTEKKRNKMFFVAEKILNKLEGLWMG